MWVKVIDRSHPCYRELAYVTSLGTRYSVKYWMKDGHIREGGKRVLYPWQVRAEKVPERVRVEE